MFTKRLVIFTYGPKKVKTKRGIRSPRRGFNLRKFVAIFWFGG